MLQKNASSSVFLSCFPAQMPKDSKIKIHLLEIQNDIKYKVLFEVIKTRTNICHNWQNSNLNLKGRFDYSLTDSCNCFKK